MSEVKQFRLPDVGEGLTEADIVSWHVKPGDSVTLNQVIVEIETAKAVVELPSPYEGIVTELLADEGVTVDVGTPIIAVDVSGEAAAEGAGRGHHRCPGWLNDCRNAGSGRPWLGVRRNHISPRRRIRARWRGGRRSHRPGHGRHFHACRGRVAAAGRL